MWNIITHHLEQCIISSSKGENIKTSEVKFRSEGSINIKKYNHIFYHEENNKRRKLFSTEEEEIQPSLIFYLINIFDDKKYFIESVNLDNNEIQVIEIMRSLNNLKTGEPIYCINKLILSKAN